MNEQLDLIISELNAIYEVNRPWFPRHSPSSNLGVMHAYSHSEQDFRIRSRPQYDDGVFLARLPLHLNVSPLPATGRASL